MPFNPSSPFAVLSRFAALIGRMLWWQRILAAVAVLALLAGAATLVRSVSKPKAVLRLAAVTRGELHVEITSSGTLQARNTVEVGTQVSGTIARLYADFNGRVRRGQLLALLDTTFLQASVLDARANFQKAEAQLLLAENARKRSETLFQEKLIPELDWETVLAQYQSVLAARTSALAQLERARINLSYAYVRSPIDGIVISRNIEVGQTVAASLNAPTLFVIADDLAKMQISAMVDEGDIGKVAVGQKALFTVDAYPERSFRGTVSKIYLQPTTVQNVVSYTAIVELDNADLSLMPGMTANVTVITKEQPDALLVPVAALAFQPAGDKAAPGRRPSDDSAAAGNRRQARPDSAAAGSPDGRRERPGQRIFVSEGRGLRPVRVRVLLNNGIMAALSGEISEGDSVAVGYNNTGGKAGSKTRSPFQQQPPSGMRRF